MPDAALFSLTDKSGATELARELAARGVAIYATGGTRDALSAEGVDARAVEEITGFPPLFGGRIKTVHPKVLGAILYDRENEEHRDEARAHDIGEFSVVVVNLYPFERTVAGGRLTTRQSSRSTSAASRCCAPLQKITGTLPC